MALNATKKKQIIKIKRNCSAVPLNNFKKARLVPTVSVDSRCVQPDCRTVVGRKVAGDLNALL